MRHALFSISIIILLSACSTMATKTTQLDVYYLQARIAPDCQKLGQIKVKAASMMDQSSADAAAQQALEKQASDFNLANTLLITQIIATSVSTNYQSQAEGVVYSCPSK